MRLIKFRAKRTDNGEWVYGESVLIDHELTDRASIMPDDTTDGLFEEVEYSTLGQFTGVYDQNNRPIYEGDILTTELTSGRKGYVEFVHGKFVMRMFDDKEQWFGLYEELIFIGNIHDNPELLKGGAQ